jgi:hypothetical protein
MTFKLTVTDNIGVSAVTGNYRWMTSGIWRSWNLDSAMTKSGNQWSTVSISVPSNATNVQYYFQVFDGTNTVYVYGGLLVTATEGTAQGAALAKIVIDNDYPTPVTDDTTVITTGDPMTFKLTVTDNIDVVTVTANYRWMTSGIWRSWNLDSPMTEGTGDQWSSGSVSAPSNATDVEYYFQVFDGTNIGYVYEGGSLDVTGIETVAQTSPLTQTVADNDYPTPSSDGTTSPTTGDPMTFSLTVTDNIDVVTMTVNYRWMTSGIWRNWNLDSAMTEGGSNLWSSGSISVPSNATNVQYYFQVSDGTNTVYVYGGLLVTITEGTAQGAALAKVVTDNDYPTPTSDDTTSPTTGDAMTFKLTVTDNIGVSAVTGNYRWMTSGIWRSWNLDSAMTKSGNQWSTVSISVPSNATNVQYYFQVSDGTNTVYVYGGLLVTITEGTAQGAALAKVVADNDAPIITGISATPQSQLVNGYVKLKATVTDNINLNKVNVTITGPAGFTPDNHSMTIESGNNYIYNRSYSIVGTYSYHIWAKDTSNNGIISSTYQFEIFAKLQITTLKTGWNFVSLPFNLTVPKTNLIVKSGGTNYTWGQAVALGIVVNTLYNWSKSTQGYVVTTSMGPGQGYWIYAYSQCELWATNLTPIINTDFITPLINNWNIVGVPIGSSVDKTTGLIVRYNSVNYNWTNAVANGYVLNTIYGWNRTAPQQYYITNTLQPGECYWLYAYVNCTLKRVI